MKISFLFKESLKTLYLRKKNTIAVLQIQGTINQKMTQQVEKKLQKIRNINNIQCLGLVINSPGGSPSQSEIISEKIKTFCMEKNIKLYTFAEDIAASGGYYLLCIGDKVFVDQSSLVGSIGVVTQSLSFGNLLENYGVEVWKLASNENLFKHQVDFLSELSEDQEKKIQNLLVHIHEQFKKHVLLHRERKIQELKIEQIDQKIFNAQVFDGSQSVSLGLADELGNFREFFNNNFPKSKIKIIESQTIIQQIIQECSTNLGINQSLENLSNFQIFKQAILNNFKNDKF